MSSKNLDASVFYVTTKGENQAPARQLIPNAVRKIFLGWRLPMEGGTGISATGVGEMWLCLGVHFSFWNLEQPSAEKVGFTQFIRRGVLAGPPELTN